MKKSTIWILTILMAITFAGLLYVQLMYMGNMTKMRDDQFAEGVKRSLHIVADSLQQNEKKHYLDETRLFFDDNVDLTQYQIYSLSDKDSLPTQTGVNYNISFKNGVKVDLTIEGKSDEIIDIQKEQTPIFGQNNPINDSRNRYRQQKGLLNDLILNILNQTTKRPINRPAEQRADSILVRRYLKTALANNGITLPFEFAISGYNNHIIYQTSEFDNTLTNENNTYIQLIFPYAPSNKQLRLSVYFPTKDDYIVSSIQFMFPSFTFTIILIIVFVFTIITAFRQKKLTEMKNDFINNMTHEFKTPISSISLAAQMLNDDTVRKSPNMLQHISTVINDETKRLRFQVEKVLQMSMFDRQKAVLRLAEVDANGVIANITSTFKLKVERYGGTIEAHLDAEDSIINVDEMHFTNVIFNLLDNAVKYRNEDESFSLLVSTRNISPDKLEITIKDNGIGIKKDDLKKIFEKFYRVSTGNRHDVKGFGLGLAYVKKMVNEFNGEIKAESEFGKGTKFIITLPLIKN